MEDNIQSNIQDENKLIEIRREKLKQIRANNNIAFPNTFKKTDYAASLQTTYKDSTKEELEKLQLFVKLSGRLMLDRGSFLVLQDTSDRIQAYVNRKVLSAEKMQEIQNWDLGDIIAIEGHLSRSNKGDLYVNLTDATLLTKSLRPLPDKYQGLKDTEQKYRQRYVDLITNDKTRNIFINRTKIINFIRQFLISKNFLEVETPMLQVIPGGASAQPFKTHHNALDLPMFLRIAPELYLKRLVVGGFDRVFEINRNFRNEGVSTRHNPEFTMIEWYMAYATYEDNMSLTEEMLKGLVLDVLGKTQFVYQGVDYDFSQNFARISLFESILKYNTHLTKDDLNNELVLKQEISKTGVKLQGFEGLGKLQTILFEETVEQNLIQPTFITQYPFEVSPLARKNDNNPFVTDRFELFIAGRELANGYSELNDAEDQADRFLKQAQNKESGDDEAMYYDADFIRALEYGMPPTSGEGIGIDRLVMLLTDSQSIRDVILFPHMRPE